MSLQRSFDGGEPVRPDPPVAGPLEERRTADSRVLAAGTFACPGCDAPVMPDGAMSPADAVGCPFCGHGARVRDFLSLAAPSRPAHVVVRIVMAH